MRQPPLSPEAWRIDGEMRGGHKPSEVLAWQAAWTEYEDEVVELRALPAGVITVGAVEPRPLAWLRRVLGR
jgi:hypothetical protein